MTALNKQALRQTAEKAQEHGVFNMDIHSQTVLALLDELEAAGKRIAELEAKLANPVLLPKTNGYWNEQEKAYEEAISLAKRQVRLAGFRLEEDE